MIVVTHTAVVQVLIHMEWIADPSIWAGLVTLVVIELVLGIDNLVFIAILAEKLPPAQRDRARITGLMLAMVMRLLLLASISWLVTLTKPLIVFHDFSFSARDMIMLFGGLFLLFKATVELNERLEGKDSDNPTQRKGAKFWAVVAQIVVLDAIFSLDSVITAVGMVDHLAVMMAAVVIAISLMLMASKALTRFVNSHPTIVILCLSFLLMIGFSLIAEGFSFIIPKGYLYAAIGFSVMIEALNQLAQFNRRRFLSANMTLRQRTTEAVMNLLSGQKEKAELDADTASLVADQDQHPLFNPQERLMIELQPLRGSSTALSTPGMLCGIARPNTGMVSSRSGPVVPLRIALMMLRVSRSDRRLPSPFQPVLTSQASAPDSAIFAASTLAYWVG